MASKRLAEIRHINNPSIASAYRPAFRSYSPQNLLSINILSALASSSTLALFLSTLTPLFPLSIPLTLLAFAWYTHISLKTNSPAQHPETLHKEPLFLSYITSLALLFYLILAST